MTLALLAEGIKSAIGLDVESVGWSAFERAVSGRMAALGLNDVDRYRQLVMAARAELQELTEVLVVPETWFFRQPEAFVALAARAERALVGNSRVFRVLSVPCSTGEEPYSIAMALLDRSVAADRFVIDAADISRRHLAAAESGTFGRNSFRSETPQAKAHLRPVRGGLQVSDRVRERVRFHHGNLIADDFMRDAPPYDAIFCRNLLIYFDAASQQRALCTLDRLLAAHGVLFVGAADAFMVLTYGFAPVEHSGTSAYAKAAERPRTAGPRVKRVEPKPAKRRAQRIPAAPASGGSVHAPCAPVAPPAEPAAATLAGARALADAGRLTEATAACRDHLHTQGPSAEAYYLLGLLADALNDPAGAVECYRKALYIDPRHEETLLQLALSAPERAGDLRGRHLRERARRTARTQANGPEATPS